MAVSRRTIYLLVLLCLGGALVVPAQAANTPYRTGLTRWQATTNGFNGWSGSGIQISADGLRLDPASARAETDPYPAGGYNGGNYYTGGAYIVGEALSPISPTRFGFYEAIASWNAATPNGTWIETQMRAQIGGRWSKWYNLGIWDDDNSTVARHSVNAQGDDDGYVAVDTLVLDDAKPSATAFQVKLRLFRAGGDALPSVRNVAVTYSTTPEKPKALLPGNPERWNRVLNVPECSQMIYPDGGIVWCSPTSVSMVLAYWDNQRGVAVGPCEPRVRATVAGVYDWIYDGHGNWPFNTAYAASKGYDGFVVRFRSMAQLEPFIAAGVPVVISYAFKKGELDNAPIAASAGHLAVVSGFNQVGNPVVNDPAAAGNDEVQRVYRRSQLESLWLQHSGGTAYIILPTGHPAAGLLQ